MKFKYISQIFMLFAMLFGEFPMEAKVRVYSFEPDTVHVLKNPLTGWVMYLGRTWDENFWAKEGYDVMPVEKVRLSRCLTMRVHATCVRVGVLWNQKKENINGWIKIPALANFFKA